MLNILLNRFENISTKKRLFMQFLRRNVMSWKKFKANSNNGKIITAKERKFTKEKVRKKFFSNSYKKYSFKMMLKHSKRILTTTMFRFTSVFGQWRKIHFLASVLKKRTYIGLIRHFWNSSVSVFYRNTMQRPLL